MSQEIPVPFPEDIAFGNADFNILPPDDASPEGRDRGAERVIAFIQKSGIFELFHDDESKKEWLQGVSGREALDFIKRLNGVIRGIGRQDRKINPHLANTLVDTLTEETAYIAPRPIAAEKVFIEKIFPILKTLPLGEASALLASEINLMHLFPDSNGRLARTMFTLFVPLNENSAPGTREALVTSSIQGRKRSYDWNPDLILKDLTELVRQRIIKDDVKLKDVEKSNGADEMSPKLNKEDSEIIYNYAKNDSNDFFLGCMLYLIMDKKIDISDFLIKDPVGQGDVLDTKKLFLNVSAKEMQHIIACSETVKLKKMVFLAEVFKEPERFKSSMPGITLKQYFEAKVVQIYMAHNSQ